MGVGKIIAAYASGNLEKGDSLFEAAGGELFVFRYGYDKLGRILSAMPQDHWLHSEAALCSLVLYLTKYGKAARAQAHMEDRNVAFAKTVRFTIFELLITIHLGDPIRDADIERWILLERRLPISKPLTEGLYCNSMLVILVRAGRLHEARSFGLRAISAYQIAKHTYLEHFIHLHLADLSIMEGHLRRGRRHLATARACLVSWGETYGNEAAIAEIIDLTLDYETGKYAHIPAQSDRLRKSLVKGDSWAEIFNQLGRISVMSLYFTAGRTAALLELELYQADYAQRHGRLSDALALLEIELDRLDHLLGGGHHRLAQLDEKNLRGPIGTVLLGGIVSALEDNDDEVVEVSGPRAQVNNMLRQARGQGAQARWRLVEQAFRLAVLEGNTAPFLENRDVLSGLGPRLSTASFARGHVQLARMARNTARAVKLCYWLPPAMKEIGINHRQSQVITALQSGATNKEIARILGVSEATVKYHLNNLYRTTQTTKRGQLLEKIHEILTLS
jgi:LuxR family maltose regulon positive regulatory protein